MTHSKTQLHNLPKYLSVRFVSTSTGLTPRRIQQMCKGQLLKAEQPVEKGNLLIHVRSFCRVFGWSPSEVLSALKRKG
jgi:hypothetical protein